MISQLHLWALSDIFWADFWIDDFGRLAMGDHEFAYAAPELGVEMTFRPRLLSSRMWDDHVGALVRMAGDVCFAVKCGTAGGTLYVVPWGAISSEKLAGANVSQWWRYLGSTRVAEYKQGKDRAWTEVLEAQSPRDNQKAEGPSVPPWQRLLR